MYATPTLWTGVPLTFITVLQNIVSVLCKYHRNCPHYMGDFTAKMHYSHFWLRPPPHSIYEAYSAPPNPRFYIQQTGKKRTSISPSDVTAMHVTALQYNYTTSYGHAMKVNKLLKKQIYT